MRTTYRLERVQDNDGKAIAGCRDEVLTIEATVDDNEGGAETLDELMDISQRFVYACGFTWAGDGQIVYVDRNHEVAPKGTMDRLASAEMEFSEPIQFDVEFPNGEFPTESDLYPRDFLHRDYELGN